MKHLQEQIEIRRSEACVYVREQGKRERWNVSDAWRFKEEAKDKCECLLHFLRMSTSVRSVCQARKRRSIAENWIIDKSEVLIFFISKEFRESNKSLRRLCQG